MSEQELSEIHEQVQRSLSNPAHQVYFRAGLLACREQMARFVEAQSPDIAQSIRANWWPQLGDDCPVCGLPVATDGRETWCTRCEYRVPAPQEGGDE